MPRRSVLSTAQLAKHYLLSDEDLELVQAHRRAERGRIRKVGENNLKGRMKSRLIVVPTAK